MLLRRVMSPATASVNEVLRRVAGHPAKWWLELEVMTISWASVFASMLRGKLTIFPRPLEEAPWRGSNAYAPATAVPVALVARRDPARRALYRLPH